MCNDERFFFVMKGWRGFLGTRGRGLPSSRFSTQERPPSDWRVFQEQLRKQKAVVRLRRVTFSLFVTGLTVASLAMSLGAVLRGNGGAAGARSSETPLISESSACTGSSELTAEKGPVEKDVSDGGPWAIDAPGRAERLFAASAKGVPSVPASGAGQGVPQRALAPYIKEILESLDSKPCIEVALSRNPCRVCTSIDTSIQGWVEGRMSRSMALAGVAAVTEPTTGRIVALVTYNKNPARKEAGFWNTYPAASLFKIVTAAAALDRGVLHPGSIVSFNGHPYALYRSSLAPKENKWTQRVTLSNAFARSVNPVFGKIGLYLLGPKPLSSYGEAFLFNRPLPTDVPVETSYLEVPEDPMGIAGIASGLNHITKISPVHAVWIGSVIVNGGAAPVPWLVERLEDGSGKTLYSNGHHEPIKVLPPQTAEKMRTMMRATITEGTCKRRFAGWEKDPVLGRLELGGKTGNVNNDENTRKYDWFVGYGLDRSSGKKVTVSVLLIHGQRIGQRANQVAKDIIRRCFD